MERRPDGVTLIAVYHWFLAVMSVLGICGLVFGVFASIASNDRSALAAILGLCFGLIMAVGSVIVNGLIGWGLWRVRSWARIGAIIVAILQLPVFPIGTIIGALILWYLLSDPDAKAAFGVT